MSGVKPQAIITSRRTWLPAWLKDRWGMVGMGLILYTLAFLAWTYFHWGGEENANLIGNLAILPPMFLGALMSWRVAAQTQPAPRVQRAWFLLGAGSFLAFLGNAAWTYLENVLGTQPFPSIADIFYLGYYPFVLWGLLMLPSSPQNRRERLIFWFDLIIVMTTASMVVGYFLIIPTATVNESDLLTQLLATAYPVFSLILLGGVLALLLRPSEADARAVLLLLLLSTGCFLVSDLAFGYTSLAGTYVAGSWVDLGWHIAQVFMVLATLRQSYRAPVPVETPRWLTVLESFVRRLPLISIVVGYGLTFYVLIVNFNQAAIWLLAGALLLTAFVIGRQIISPAFADLPIRVKVILTFFLVSALSVSLVTLMSYLTLRSNLQSAVEINLKAHARDHAGAMAGLLGKQSEALESFVLTKDIQNYASAASTAYTTDNVTVIWGELSQRDLAWQAAVDSDPLVHDVLNNAVAAELHKFRNNFPGYTNLLLTDKHGAVLAATTRPATYDQSILNWWQMAFHKGQGAIYISQPILNPATGTRHVVIAMPVREQLSSDLIGILMATNSLEDMAQILASEDLEPRIEFYLMLPTGQMLTADDQFVFIQPDTLERLQATSDANSTLMNFLGSSQLVSQALVSAPDPEEVMAYESLNWILLARQDPGEAFAPLNAVWRTTLLSTVIVLLLTAGLAVVLSQVLVAPIFRLTATASQIGSGDLSTKAQVESRDEIGTLAATFNAMLDTLNQTQQELQESESLYRSLIDFSPDMIVVHREGKVLFINPAGVRLLGAPDGVQFVGQPLMDLIHPEDQEVAKEDLEKIYGTGEPSPLLQRKMHRLNGTTFDAEFRAIPISYVGRPAIQFIMRDITERKEAEEKIRELLIEVGRQRGDLELRVAQRTEELNGLNLRLQAELAERQRLVQSLQESEQRFHQVFETSPDAIFLLDPHDPSGTWKIVDCNPSACQMNGYTREELIGQPLDILNVQKSSPEEYAASLERLRHENGLRGIEAAHIHKDGHSFPIEYSTSLVTLGNYEMVLGIDRDITERKQVEEALRYTKQVAEDASRAKSEFLSRMSHELRTPMNAILGFAQLLTMSQKDPLTPLQKERVKQIVKGGEHLLDLINEILDISRIEAGRVQISPEPVSIRESLQEALDLTMPLANNRSIQMQLSLPAEFNPFVRADRQRLKQILLNLLSNAVKYNRPGGFVAILCEATQSDRAVWRISVTDTGQGISPENLPQLFVPFERLAADQSNIEGTGLGLALAKRLVELMKGKIGVESVLGQGSTFWIELPATESQLDRFQRSGGTGKLPALSKTNRTILYIEDNVANFELVQQVLADYGQIELLWANDLETSMVLVHQHHPDLILLDLHLGGKDGSEVLKQLKENKQTANIPVIMVSADATAGQVERLMALGAHSYLTKPLDVKLFIQRIEQLLREAMNDGKY